MTPKDKRTNEEIAIELMGLALTETGEGLQVRHIKQALDAKDTELQALREKVDQLSKENLELLSNITEVIKDRDRISSVKFNLDKKNQELLSLIEVMREKLHASKMRHYYCEDSWYSCPKAEDGCSNEADGDKCNCGAEAFNLEIDKLLSNPPLTHIVEVNRAKDEVIEAKKYKRLGRCIQWTGLMNGHGYGRVMISRRKSVMPHRAMYEGVYGKIPKHLVIDHLCRNRACINPLHLRVVTSKENILCGVGYSAKNARKTCCPKGHKYSGVDYKGSRICIKCRRVNNLGYRMRRKKRKAILAQLNKKENT